VDLRSSDHAVALTAFLVRKPRFVPQSTPNVDVDVIPLQDGGR
jgi:hypothetical protein